MRKLLFRSLNQKVSIKTLRIISAALVFMSLKSNANDVVINVTGRFVPLPCTVETTQLRLDLGKIYASTLAKAGSSGQWVYGTIMLKDCPSITNGVTAKFSGLQGSYYYRNTGTAKNVEIQLQTADGSDLSNGKSQEITITRLGTAELPVRVRAYSGAGKAVDGTIQSTINVIYTYQ